LAHQAAEQEMHNSVAQRVSPVKPSTTAKPNFEQAGLKPGVVVAMAAPY
jgi:hypothetical protein